MRVSGRFGTVLHSILGKHQFGIFPSSQISYISILVTLDQKHQHLFKIQTTTCKLYRRSKSSMVLKIEVMPLALSIDIYKKDDKTKLNLSI